MYYSVKNAKQKEAERIQYTKSENNIEGNLTVTIDHGSLERKYDDLGMSTDVETYDVAY